MFASIMLYCNMFIIFSVSAKNEMSGQFCRFLLKFRMLLTETCNYYRFFPQLLIHGNGLFHVKIKFLMRKRQAKNYAHFVCFVSSDFDLTTTPNWCEAIGINQTNKYNFVFTSIHAVWCWCVIEATVNSNNIKIVLYFVQNYVYISAAHCLCVEFHIRIWNLFKPTD